MKNLKNLCRVVACLALSASLYTSYNLKKQNDLYDVAPSELVSKLNDGKYVFLIISDEKLCKFCGNANEVHESLNEKLKDEEILSLMEINSLDSYSNVEFLKFIVDPYRLPIIGSDSVHLPFYAIFSPKRVRFSLNRGVMIAKDSGFIFGSEGERSKYEAHLIGFLKKNVDGLDLSEE